MISQALLVAFALFTLAVIALAFYFRNSFFKFLVVAYLAILASAIYFMYDGVKGWPTDDDRVVKGILSSVVIVNPSDMSDGAIYISLFPTVPSEWYEYRYHREAPRTFYVKYTNDRAAEFERAKQALMEGKEVRINGIPPEVSTGTGNSEDNQSLEEGIIGAVSDFVERLMAPQGDTYRPEVPDIEIIQRDVPPQKGTN
jgi:hypothetical protein